MYSRYNFQNLCMALANLKLLHSDKDSGSHDG